MKKNTEPNSWLKNRGYLHIANQTDLTSKDRFQKLIQNKRFVATHAFYPLIHSIIKERRFKKSPLTQRKCHSFQKEDGTVKKNLKKRPLHYATHLDAIIFGYYSHLLVSKYEERLLKTEGLTDCITAYRKIPTGLNSKNKGTIHFSHEVFEEIERRASVENCIALKLDIKSFFNEIDHGILKRQWSSLLDREDLPSDHYNVFKGATRFSYIMKDDLRVGKTNRGKRKGFDEKRLAELRKKGTHAFFESGKDFREAVDEGKITIHKYPFWKNGYAVGIPQGLPISATLANIYLLDFDIDILENIVKKLDAHYKRYSDDIIVLCKEDQADYVEAYVKAAITSFKVEISDEKTEKFLFARQVFSGHTRIESRRIVNGIASNVIVPFTYLGFEYYGFKTLIKSANLAKFYRRMISSAKTKVRRAISASENNPETPFIIYRNQLRRMYTTYPLSESDVPTKRKFLVKNERGDFHYVTKEIPAKRRCNYLSYVYRASEIMNEPLIVKQIAKHKVILHQAIHRQIERRKTD